MTNKSKIFLDYNATTPLLVEAKEVMVNAMSLPLNPSSTHSFGAEGKRLLRNAREMVQRNLGAENATIIFTASGTESNNMALKGLRDISKIFVSSIEHDSVLKPASYMNSTFINVDDNGLVDLSQLEQECKSLKAQGVKFLVSIIHANNETGVIQKISEIAPIIYSNGGYLHIDASQSVGKIDFDFNSLNVDMATISSHKLGGPKGAAALIIKPGLEIEPLILGGGQEQYLRAGTENLPAIIGFSKAVETSVARLKDYQEKTSDLISYFEGELEKISEDIEIFSSKVDRLPNTSNFSLPNCDNETSLINLDLSGIAVSAGSACSSGRVVSSHVLAAMRVKGDVAKTAIRVSIGHETTHKQIDFLLEKIKDIYTKKNLKNAA